MVRKVNFVLVILMLCALFFLGYSGKTPEAAEDKAPVKIGSAGPMSGPAAWEAGQMKNGERLAVEEWNAAGGILGGRKIEYLGPLDDRSIPEEGVTVIKKLLSQGASGLLLAFNSSVALAENPVMAENKINAIHPVAMHPKAADVKNGIFGANVDVPTANKAHIAWMVNYYKMKSVYLIVELTDYGQGLVDTFTSEFKKYGVEVKGVDRVEITETDYSLFVSKSVKSGADIIMPMLAAYAQINGFLKECQAQGVPITKIGFTANIEWDEFIKVQGPYLDGAAATSIWAADMGRLVPAYNAFAEKYEKRYKEKITSKYPMLGYQAAWMMIKAMDMAGSDKDHAAWTKAMLQLTWDSPRGKCKIDPTLGRPYAALYIVKVAKGKAVTEGIAWEAPELK